MKIRYIDGTRLKHAIIAGSNLVTQRQDHLNRINVFPVPDSDTGTNMASTMQSIADSAANCSHRSVYFMSQVLAESALLGAQGNSGAILAQFFHGLAEGLKGKLRVTTQSFGEAVKKATEYAYEAMAEPKEGTILTVIKDWAAHIQMSCHKTHDFVDLLRNSLHAARKSLAETPKKLDVLAKAGVVDAGAQGFVHLLEGIFNFIKTGKIEEIMREGLSESVTTSPLKEALPEIHFQYCTECLITGENIDRDTLRTKLTELGDSLIVAGSSSKVRIHIHTNTPHKVFDVAQRFGAITQQKTDDMKQQHAQAFVEQELDEIAIVSDSTCDLPYNLISKYNIHIIPVKVIFGSETFIDRVNITPVQFYDKLINSPYHPTTSQPAAADFKKVYERLVSHYKSIISIHLPRQVSGTIQTAETAAKMVDGDKITIIDARNTSVALGLIVLEAARAASEGLSLAEVITKINTAVEKTKLFACFPTLKYLVRGGRISKTKGLIGKLINLKPIVTFDRQGKAVLVSKSIGNMKALNKTMKLVKRSTVGLKNLRFGVAHANAIGKAEWVVKEIKKAFGVTEVTITDASPALGVHAGPGTTAVAILGD